MNRIEDNSYFERLIQHIEQRVKLKDEEEKYICSLFSIRKLLPRQYLVAQGELCRYESYVTEGFLRSFMSITMVKNTHFILRRRTGGYQICRAFY